MAKNLLLFVSALIPKALASLLTSCVIELAKPDNVRILETTMTVVYEPHLQAHQEACEECVCVCNCYLHIPVAYVESCNG